MQQNELSSELEYLILAMVGEGINSGYAMRLEMQKMRGGRWSAESGSVYRVLRRLLSAGYLSETGRVGVPNRERTEYALTPSGQAAIRQWLSSPLGPEELELLVDPLRTRTFFLHRLMPAERSRAVKSWTLQNRRLIAELERSVEDPAAPSKSMAISNLLCLAKARQDWLKKLQSQTKQGGSLGD